jgi:threonine dehydrogenase-like Zn-dependent dehydrogenase
MAAISESLPKSMTAVVCHGPEDYRLEERPVPRPGTGEIVISIDACGICASDIKCFSGAALFWGDENREGYCTAPITPGHEFIGTVVALGDGAGEKYGLALGDRAISEQIVPCWNCRYCRRGQYHMCAKHDIYGFHGPNGGFAQYMAFPADALNYKVPREIPVQHAALIEPLACSMHAVDRAKIEFADTVVISGCGPLGLGMVAYASLKSPAQLVAIDLQDDRLDRAKKLGATHTLNPCTVNVVDAVRELTEGYGCDVYIEATGHPASVEQGLLSLRKQGRFVEFSVMREPVTTDWTIIGDTKELDLYGSHLGPYCYEHVIRLLAGGFPDASQFISHDLPLAKFMEGIELASRGVRSLKVLLTP